MANPWFRMYHEFATDPKVQMLSEVVQRRYVMLLCLRCSNGDVTLQDPQVAFQLRISLPEWLETKAELMGIDMVDEHSVPTAWSKRQYASDSSTARVAAYRERMKQEGNVTGTKCNAIDTETDTETEESKPFVAVPATADSLGDDQSGSAAPGSEETKKTSIKYSEVQAAYNEICGEVLSKCKVMNPKRKRLIVAAAAIDVDGFKPFREHGIEFWKAYFVECMKNPHWRGESKFGNNSSDWKADFDFLVRMDNVIKVLEKL
ncbi:MAG: hypothetical protein J6D44_14440 [Pseudomonas sp.]|nr:hypothetical protein [Pseudomonas sp.]